MGTRSKFKPGQLVSVSIRSKLGFSPKGTYRIVRALPNAGGPVLYRVKSERIVDESEVGFKE